MIDLLQSLALIGLAGGLILQSRTIRRMLGAFSTLAEALDILAREPNARRAPEGAREASSVERGD